MAAIEVLLTRAEMMVAACVGAMRNISSIDSPDAHGFAEEHGWNAHIEGVCGEIAAAKVTQRYWQPTVDTFRAPDIGLNIQVRTRSRHDYDLLVRPNDNPQYAFIHVTGRAPRFLVHGYLLGERARRVEWMQEHAGRPPAWFVPASSLWPISDLIVR
jgi:hypothetical protein